MIYLAERDAQLWCWASRGIHPPMRLRILLSYWYYKDTDLDALFHARLVALCKAGLPRMALLTREKQAKR